MAKVYGKRRPNKKPKIKQTPRSCVFGLGSSTFLIHEFFFSKPHVSFLPSIFFYICSCIRILERVFQSFFQGKKIQKTRSEIFIQGKKKRLEG
jgi:hypothetical protein